MKPNLKDEKDEYVYRSFIGLGQYNIVLSEVSDSSSTPIGTNNKTIILPSPLNSFLFL